MVLYNGQTLNETDGKISNFGFSESDFNFNNLNSNTITTIKTQETSTIELFKCLNDLNKGVVIRKANNTDNKSPSPKFENEKLLFLTCCFKHVVLKLLF